MIVRCRGVLVVLVALTTGCGGSEKAQSPPAERRANVVRPAPSEPGQAPGTIVIRGRKDAAPSGRREDEEDREKIAELEEQARASQGKPVGAPRATGKPHEPAPQADPEVDEKAQLDQEIAGVSKQITDLETEKESLLEDKKVRRGSRRVTREVSTDPARTKEIEAKLVELEARKQELEQRREALPR